MIRKPVDEETVRALVSEINSHTPCLTQDQSDLMEYLITRIVRGSEKHFSPAQVRKVVLALRLSAKWHEGIRRKERNEPPYITHPFSVAVAFFNRGVYDFKLIIATILHDVVEDAKNKDARYRYRKTIRVEFGSTVLAIVDLVTKGRQPWEKAQFFTLLVRDKRPGIAWRARLLKLGDCAHNAESFDVFEPNRRLEKIQEVRKEYPPVVVVLNRDLRKLVREKKLPAEPYAYLATSMMQEITDALDHHLLKR